VRPLTGPGDWLERVIWMPADQSAVKRRTAKAELVAQRVFRPDKDGFWKLTKVHGDTLSKRLALVVRLGAFLRLDEQRARRTGSIPSDTVLSTQLAAVAESL
jgi:hypothetical protein